ncbi:MAG: hypothetical protein ACRDKX_00755, partial [Solirubrobacterales bacterium]
AGERYDGRGPAALAGVRIPLEARIMRAACACDRANGEAAALHAVAGGELDPQVVEALAGMLGRARSPGRPSGLRI